MTLKEFLEKYVEPHCVIWVWIVNNEGLFVSTCPSIQQHAAKHVTSGLIGNMHLDKEVVHVAPTAHGELVIYIKGE